MTQKDISVICNFESESILEAVRYCETRGITCEVVESIVEATGKYVSIPNELTYYHEYYLHIQFVALEYRNPKCNIFQYNKVVVYSPDIKEFYMGNISRENRFFRNNYVNPIRFIEPNIILGCTLREYEGLKCNVPDDNILIDYNNYFLKNKMISE